MKTPEDEAFDELERRQGGFQAKRAMAANKLQEPAQLTEKEKISREMTAEIAAARALAQPAQKIPYPVTGWKVEVRGSNQQLFITGVYGDTIFVDLPVQPVQQEPVAWCPDVCPITGLPFFMWIEHHETGQMMPTYGGPYDSYTIPVRDKDGSYCRERYDHDNGWWVTDEVEDVGVQIVSDQAYVSEDEPPQRKPLTDKEINDLRLALDYDIEDLPDPWDFKQGFRVAERAYGIKEKNT